MKSETSKRTSVRSVLSKMIAGTLVASTVLGTMVTPENGLAQTPRAATRTQPHNFSLEQSKEKLMALVFQKYANASRRHKLAKDFLFDIGNLNIEDRTYIEKNLGSAASPQIITIKNGMRVSWNGRTQTVVFSAKTNTLVIDGKSEFPSFNLRSLQKMVESEGDVASVSKSHSQLAVNVLQLMFPSSHAIGGGLALVGKILWGSLKSVLYADAVVVVAGAGLSGVACVVGVVSNGTGEKSNADACADYAGGTASIIAGFTVLGNVLGVPSFAVADAYLGAKNPYVGLSGSVTYTADEMAKLMKFRKALNGFGVLGLGALALYGAERFAASHGMLLECDGNKDGAYTLHSLASGKKADLLWAVEPVRNSDWWSNRPNTTWTLSTRAANGAIETRKFLGSTKRTLDAALSEIPLFSKNPDMRKAIVKDHESYASYCKENPNSKKSYAFADIKGALGDKTQSSPVAK